ncbi:MAG: DUF881 domain-containing protein [Bacillota bacterium]
MKNIKFQIAMALVCVVLGLMITVQLRTVKGGLGAVSEFKAREMTAQLKRLEEERDALLALKNEYEKKIREYEETASQGSMSAKILKSELDNARVIAGLEDVEGPGVTVVVDDLNASQQVGYLIIDQGDLLYLVNSLNAAGAEAISINGQRIIATSEIHEAGNFININTVKFAPPFTIKAIGDPATLEGALMIRGGIVEIIEMDGGYVTITKEQNIKIPKYNGVIERIYARVVKEGDDQ